METGFPRITGKSERLDNQVPILPSEAGIYRTVSQVGRPTSRKSNDSVEVQVEHKIIMRLHFGDSKNFEDTLSRENGPIPAITKLGVNGEPGRDHRALGGGEMPSIILSFGSKLLSGFPPSVSNASKLGCKRGRTNLHPHYLPLPFSLDL